VVEGDAEFDALPRLHKKSLIAGCPPLRATNMGGIGSDITPTAIARRVVGSVIAHQAAGRTKVVVCFDREQRQECPGELALAVLSALRDELAKHNRSSSDVHVVVADRAFEAWILADADGLHKRGALARAPSFHSFEGSLGLSSAKGKADLTKLLSRTYSETSDGPKLFEQIDFACARKFEVRGHRSRSLDKFLRTLGV
jgi:hypothetical protein